ncbi:MAG: TonB-dependent receptor domain-containing protein, partial [Pyrinomonadaceae bacterium]
GDVLTRANENLRAERLTGVEGGTLLEARSRRFSLRATGFWSEVDHAIANTTLSVSPSLITRQRQNLGKTRSRGMEIDLEFQPYKSLRIFAGYFFADAKVVEFAGSDSLVGRMVPQVPRHQYSFQVVYQRPALFDLTIQGRGGSLQFDDDQNLFPLHRFFTMDARISRRIRNGFEIFASFENILNQRYEVGRTPIVTLGTPATVRVGFRFGT